MANISAGKQQITVTLPKEYVQKLEEEAKLEIRDRSAQAAKIIMDYYKAKEKNQV